MEDAGPPQEPRPVLRFEIRGHRRSPVHLVSAKDTLHHEGPVDLSPNRWFTHPLHEGGGVGAEGWTRLDSANPGDKPFLRLPARAADRESCEPKRSRERSRRGQLHPRLINRESAITLGG